MFMIIVFWNMNYGCSDWAQFKQQSAYERSDRCRAVFELQKEKSKQFETIVADAVKFCFACLIESALI